MSTYTKQLLSGSTNGLGIKLTQTSTPGNTLHTAVSGTSALDEIWLYAYNAHTADVVLTIEWGQTTVPDGNIIVYNSLSAGKIFGSGWKAVAECA
jgi:hypothetical protein